MYKLTFVMIASLFAWSGAANAQYVNEKPQGPLLGGAGDYSYPLLCRACKVWQDYRNFAWNQLSLHGGPARTPTNPNNVTTFWIFSHPTKDLYPTIVDVTLEVVDVVVMNSKVGHTVAKPEHYFVHTHTDNGDKVRVNFYPKNMRKLMFPYDSRSGARRRSGGFTRGTRPGRRGSGGGGWGGGFGWGGGGGWGRGGTGIGGWAGGNAGGNFCGIGTDYICIQF